MKLFFLAIFVTILVVIGKAPSVIRMPLLCGFIVLSIIVGIWRRATPAGDVPPT